MYRFFRPQREARRLSLKIDVKWVTPVSRDIQYQYCVDVVGIWKLFRFNKVPLVYYSVPSVYLYRTSCTRKVKDKYTYRYSPGSTPRLFVPDGIVSLFFSRSNCAHWSSTTLSIQIKFWNHLLTHQVRIMYVTKHRLTKFVFNYTREPMFTQWYLNLYLRTSVTQHIHWVRRGTENLGGMFLFHFTIIATAGVSNSRFLGFLGIFF